jgi:two-component system, LytTR family, sensor kinase
MDHTLCRGAGSPSCHGWHGRVPNGGIDVTSVQVVHRAVQPMTRGLRRPSRRPYASVVTDLSAHTNEFGVAREGRPSHVRLRRTEMLGIFAFWTFLAVLSAANNLLDPRGRGLQPIVSTAPVALAFVESYLWAALTPVLFWLTSRYSLERANRVGRVLFFVGVGFVVAMAVEALLAYLRFEVFVIPMRRRPPTFNPLFGITRLFWLDDLMVYFAIVAAGFARDYFRRYQARREEASQLRAQTAELHAQLAEARLAALRTQLNPHFLFNTLHAVSTLVERDPRGVRRMIARLSELLRSSLEGGDEQEVPLEEELAFLNRYLEIMQIRFQGRLEVDTRVDSAVMDALVPTLILQPLVENAVKHGVSKVAGTGRIEIRAHRDAEDRVVLSVRDNGPGLDRAEGAPREEGVGLANTRARLQQLYGSVQSLTLQPAPAGVGLVAEVTLPYHTRADLRTAGVPSASAGEPRDETLS